MLCRDLTTLFAGPQLTTGLAEACCDMAGATKVVGAAGTDTLDLENMQVRLSPAAGHSLVLAQKGTAVQGC